MPMNPSQSTGYLSFAAQRISNVKFDEHRHENDFTEKYPQHKDEIPFAHSCSEAFLILGKIVML